MPDDKHDYEDNEGKCRKCERLKADGIHTATTKYANPENTGVDPLAQPQKPTES